MTICNRLVKTLASVFLATSDIQMDVASGSMIIITVKRSMQKHKLLSLNAMKELVLADKNIKSLDRNKTNIYNLGTAF